MIWKHLSHKLCLRNKYKSSVCTLQGCYNAIMRTIEANKAIVIGVASGLALVEILVIILALHLACCYWRPQHGRLALFTDASK